MRKLLGIIAAGLLAFAATAPATAGTLDPSNSVMTIKIGGLPTIVIPASNNLGTLDPGTADVTLSASVFNTTAPTGFPGTAIITGVPLIDMLIVTMFNGAGTFSTGFSATNPVGTGALVGGGVAGVAGQGVIILVPTGIPIGLSVVGQGGTATATGLGQPVTITGAAWGTNSVQITGILSNVVTITNAARAGAQGIAFTLDPTANENTVTATQMFMMLTFPLTQTHAFVTGSRNTSAGAGTITLISPMRVITGLGRLLPGVTKLVLTFVPEPGTLLLFVASVVGLAIAGRKRLRK